MTRAEHMRWCKQRALEYVEQNDPINAVASMLSDLSKHPETKALGERIGMLGLLAGRDVTEARKFIEGFAE